MLSGIQTESIVNICRVPMYTSVCVPIDTRCGILGTEKNENFISNFLKIGCYEDILNASYRCFI